MHRGNKISCEKLQSSSHFQRKYSRNNKKKEALSKRNVQLLKREEKKVFSPDCLLTLSLFLAQVYVKGKRTGRQKKTTQSSHNVCPLLHTRIIKKDERKRVKAKKLNLHIFKEHTFHLALHPQLYTPILFSNFSLVYFSSPLCTFLPLATSIISSRFFFHFHLILIFIFECRPSYNSFLFSLLFSSSLSLFCDSVFVVLYQV